MPNETPTDENEKVFLRMPADLYNEVVDLAKASDISVQHFIRRIVTEAVKHKVIYSPTSGVFEEPAPYNKETK